MCTVFAVTSSWVEQQGDAVGHGAWALAWAALIGRQMMIDVAYSCCCAPDRYIKREWRGVMIGRELTAVWFELKIMAT